MTCLFDLDRFNTRRFKPYTVKTLVCANYLSESDREGGDNAELSQQTSTPPGFGPGQRLLRLLCSVVIQL